MDLFSKSAVITGGAMGIGFSTAKRLLREGCQVTIWDINEKALAIAKKLLEKEGYQVFTYLCDVTDKDRVYELAQCAISSMGQVDILINNAGFVMGGELLNQSDDILEKILNVNLTSMIYTIRAFLPGMLERNSGAVINISSAAGMVGVPGLAIYSASKWGVWGLTESLRMEAYNKGKSGIKWSTVFPGYVARGMFEGARLKGLGSLLFPLIKEHDAVAKIIVDSAIKKGRYSPKLPGLLKISLILRGLLPDFLFQKLMILLGVPHSMDNWYGRQHFKKTTPNLQVDNVLQELNRFK